MLTRSRPRQASMAAEPVSPDVATSTVAVSSRRVSSRSISRPTSWRAMSLNARVGPRNSSATCSPSERARTGTTAGSSKRA